MNRKIVSLALVSALFLSAMFLTAYNTLGEGASFSSDKASFQGAWDWVKFHHDSRNLGYSPSLAPNTNNTLWIGKGDTAVVVYKGVVYAGSYNRTHGREVYAFNATTGVEMWSFKAGGYITPFGPSVANDRIFVGSSDGNIYALDALNGTETWRYATGGVVESSAAIVDDVLFIASQDGYVYALNATQGNMIWRSSDQLGIMASAPAVADDRVFIGVWARNALFCLNAISGKSLWNYTTGGPVTSSPTVMDGKVYFSSEDGLVYALNESNETLIWNYTTEAWIKNGGSPAVAYGKVFIASCDLKVYALDKDTGALAWSYQTGTPLYPPTYAEMYSAPAVADGKVFVGAEDGRVYALNASTGTPLWSYQTGDKVFSSPAIAYGRVFVGSNDGKLYCFGLIAAIVDIDPDTLNLWSRGNWITAYITLPEDYNVSDINVGTILLNGTIPAEWSDLQDGVLMVKFDKANVTDLIIDALDAMYGNVTLTITGELNDGTPFEGSYTFRVISPVKLNRVHVVDLDGNPRNSYQPRGQIFVEIVVNNTTPFLQNLTIVMEIQDESGALIGAVILQGAISVNISVFMFSLPIPARASTGTATVSVNAYTDPPWTNGLPYCPETSTPLTIENE